MEPKVLINVSIHVENVTVHVTLPNQKPKRAVRIAIFNDEGKETMSDEVQFGNQRKLTGVPVDKDGKPAPLLTGSVLEWSIDPPNGSLFPSSDGSTCDVAWAAEGTSTITSKGKSAKGADISGTKDLVFLPQPIPEAVGVDITAGPETPVG